MGIRIQPKDIEIPAENPFKYDLLDRKEKIEVLTRLVGNVEGPCSMAVDAAWGAGKTTFLKMWARHLRNEGFPVVEFNAWETDFTGEPFVALSSEITEELKVWGDSSVKQKIQDSVERLIDKGKDVLRLAISLGIRGAAATQPEVDPAIANAVASAAENWFTDYPEARKSVREFKGELEGLADELWHASGGKPLVVFIDELDRCRPSYAIELLETGKHIFSVDHVVFVLAVNRTELAKSVKVLYGDEFDAEGYLKRFFDIDFLLPAPDREQFIDGMFETVGIREYLTRTNDRTSQNLSREALDVIRAFFGRGNSPLSLRTVGQSIHRFGLVLSSLGDDEKGYVCTLALLTAMAMLDESLYRGFVSGELTDAEVAEALFDTHAPAALRETPAGHRIEAIIIASRIDWSDFRMSAVYESGSKAPLWYRYREIADMEMPADRAAQAAWSHAHDIYQMVLHFFESSRRGNEFLGFQQSVQRIELLSPDLLGVEQTL